MRESLRQNLTATDTWVRGLFMLLFMIIYGVAKSVWYLIVLFQFIHTLFKGKPNDPLLDFSENLCAYLYEILLYVSFSSHDLPFPFAPWPSEGVGYVYEEFETAETESADEGEERVEGVEEADEPLEEQSASEAASPEDAGEQAEPRGAAKTDKTDKSDKTD